MPDYDRPCLIMAATMLNPSKTDTPDPGQLNYTLAEELRETDNLCQKVGGKLHSRKVIALIIRRWIAEHPHLSAYGG